MTDIHIWKYKISAPNWVSDLFNGSILALTILVLIFVILILTLFAGAFINIYFSVDVLGALLFVFLLVLTIAFTFTYESEHLSHNQIKAKAAKNLVIMAAFLILNQALFIPLISPRLSIDSQTISKAILWTDFSCSKSNCNYSTIQEILELSSVFPLIQLPDAYKVALQIPLKGGSKITRDSLNPLVNVNMSDNNQFLLITPSNGISGWNFGPVKTKINLERAIAPETLRLKENIYYNGFDGTSQKIIMLYEVQNNNDFPVWVVDKKIRAPLNVDNGKNVFLQLNGVKDNNVGNMSCICTYENSTAPQIFFIKQDKSSHSSCETLDKLTDVNFIDMRVYSYPDAQKTERTYFKFSLFDKVWCSIN